MDFPVDLSDAVSLGETETGTRPPGNANAAISEGPTLGDSFSASRPPVNRAVNCDDGLILAEEVHGPFSADQAEALNLGDNYTWVKPPEKNPEVNFAPRKRRKFFP